MMISLTVPLLMLTVFPVIVFCSTGTHFRHDPYKTAPPATHTCNQPVTFTRTKGMHAWLPPEFQTIWSMPQQYQASAIASYAKPLVETSQHSANERVSITSNSFGSDHDQSPLQSEHTCTHAWATLEDRSAPRQSPDDDELVQRNLHFHNLGPSVTSDMIQEIIVQCVPADLIKSITILNEEKKWPYALVKLKTHQAALGVIICISQSPMHSHWSPRFRRKNYSNFVARARRETMLFVTDTPGQWDTSHIMEYLRENHARNLDRHGHFLQQVLSVQEEYSQLHRKKIFVLKVSSQQIRNDMIEFFKQHRFLSGTW